MKVLTFTLGALRTNTYFCLNDTGDCVVIDPGMDGEGIAEKLRQKGLNPSHILLTHGHFDHSQGVKALREATGARVLVHRDDSEMLSDPGKNSAGFYYCGDFSAFPRSFPDQVLCDGDVIKAGELSFRVIHTPGHTPGSVCFLSENVLFCGDTVFAYGYGRYDLWGGDPHALAASLKKIAGMEGDLKLCPGHGNTATLARIRDQIASYAKELE